MNRKIRLFGSLMMLVGVVLGALGSHVFKSVLPSAALESFHTGLEYLIYHALALLLLSNFEFHSEKRKMRAVYFMVFGVLLLSVSIFLLSFKSLIPINISWMGPLTPLGGFLLIAGWGLTAFNFLKK